MEPTHLGSVLDLHGCSYFSNFIPGFNGVILSVVDDVSVDSEPPMVTSLISRFVGLTQFFAAAHKGRVYEHAFIE
jgi:hypothetical protein